MKYALVIVESNNLSAKSLSLENFASRIEIPSSHATKKTSPIVMLNIGAYLLDLSYGIQYLAHIAAQAETYKLSFRTLFFEDQPSWVITSNV